MLTNQSAQVLRTAKIRNALPLDLPCEPELIQGKNKEFLSN